ncbi:hypothetical protein BKA64DRAFT_689639 [Cadophora sp. MPI-SDFR-AT-0126]|nr:hypothetical protein BKA64DRAFT_689639 [Leotiomycetes sp. MPI-SDFR-AT-0126]
MTAGFSCNEASFDAYTRHLLAKTPGTSSGPVSENDGDADPRAYQLLVQQCTCNRRLLLTQNGYLGIGPKALQSDDQIWILFGARTPIAFRPNSDYYQVAGDCYVHGYMNGEGVQGLDAGKFVDEDVVLC